MIHVGLSVKTLFSPAATDSSPMKLKARVTLYTAFNEFQAQHFLSSSLLENITKVYTPHFSVVALFSFIMMSVGRLYLPQSKVMGKVELKTLQCDAQAQAHTRMNRALVVDENLAGNVVVLKICSYSQLVQLSGLSASLGTKRSQVRFRVRALDCVGGGCPVGVCKRQPHVDVSLSLPPFPSF